jgi:2-dehydro-3-deoxyphosphogluconate aldolase / (4S)-4-hydroxy-2-oxoglutarate aldolase
MPPTGKDEPMDILSALSRTRLVPVVVLDDVRDAAPLAGALVAGGLPVAEVTFRTAAAGDAIRAMADRGDVLVGAGTVLTPAQVDEAVAAGATYVVSPGLSRAVVERCGEHGILALPGVVTATEVQAALELGLGTVKFFPAGTSGGAPAIAALAGPFGGVRFIPTGGIGPANLHEYLGIDAVAAVGGSWMVPRERIRAGDFGAIERLTADAVALLRPSAPTSLQPAHQGSG